MGDPVTGPLGLALGLPGVFLSCVQCLELVDSGKNYAKELEVIWTKYDAQRVRLLIWGQVTGITGNLPFDTTLNDPEIHASIERNLNCIKLLFDDVDKLQQKYGLTGTRDGQNTPTQGGLRERYQLFHDRLLKTQSSAGVGKKTKWAIRNKKKFVDLVTDITALVDALETITKSAQTLSRRIQIVQAEVEAHSDAHSLRTIEQATIDSARVISDTENNDTFDDASVHLVRARLLRDGYDDVATFYTRDDDSSVRGTFVTAPSTGAVGVTRDPTSIDILDQPTRDLPLSTQQSPPQNQRVMSNLALRAFVAQPSSTLSSTSRESDILRRPNPRLKFPNDEDLVASGLSGGMKTVLRYLKREQVRQASGEWEKDPTVYGFAPVSNDISDILGFIVGGQGTPYAGGTFWIRIHLTNEHPFRPPICKFLTKIYHPNIDSRGRICVDILGKDWSPILMTLSPILISILSMLDDPNVNDPLVPEIAAQYIQDRETYNENARRYTALYAGGDIPELDPPDETNPWWRDMQVI